MGVFASINKDVAVSGMAANHALSSPPEIRQWYTSGTEDEGRHRQRIGCGLFGLHLFADRSVLLATSGDHDSSKRASTLVADRQDALVAAARLTLAVQEIAKSETGAQVGTVGHFEVSPNASNVIPGEVKMSVEFRDLSGSKLDALGAKLKSHAASIASESRTRVQVTFVERHDSATAAPEVQRAIEGAASRLHLDTRHLPSGAGHDAQMMAKRMPMGMIFVPSVGGISHSPKEFTTAQDCANGANVLLETVLSLAT